MNAPLSARWAMLASLLGAAAALWIALALNRPDAPSLEWDKAIHSQAQPSLAQGVDANDGSVMLRSRLESGSVCVTVVSESGESISGAEVFRSRSLPRQSTPDSEVLLGTTDANGMLQLSANETDLGAFLVARANGYTAAHSGYPSGGEPAVVVLRLGQGHDLAGRVVTSDGNGLKGATVCVSRTPLSGFLPTPGVKPGAVASESVYTACSDDQGDFRMHGLASGRYDIRVLHPTHTWVDSKGEFASPGLTIPRSPLTVEVAPMEGFAVRVVGDVVLATQFSYADPTSFWHWDLVKRAEHERVRAVWGPHCISALRVKGKLGPQPVDVRVFMAESGWSSIRIGWSDYAIGQGVIDVPHSGQRLDTSTTLSTVGLHVVDGEGHELPVRGLCLLAEFDGGFIVECSQDGETRVPPGRYRLSSSEPFFNRLVSDRTIEAKPGEVCRDRVIVDLVLCEFRFLLADNRLLPGNASVKLVELSAGTEDLLFVPSGSRILLPRGAVTYEVRTPTYSSQLVRADIVVGVDAPCILRCVLQ